MAGKKNLSIWLKIVLIHYQRNKQEWQATFTELVFSTFSAKNILLQFSIIPFNKSITWNETMKGFPYELSEQACNG